MASKLEKMVFNKNFLCRKYTTPNRPHSHTVWELVLFEKGETSNFVNDTEFVAKPGDAFLIGPPHTHAIVFRTTPHLHRDLYYKDEEVRAVCAMFSGDLYEKICNGIFNFHISSNDFQAIIRQSDKLDSLSVIAGNFVDDSENHSQLKKSGASQIFGSPRFLSLKFNRFSFVPTMQVITFKGIYPPISR